MTRSLIWNVAAVSLTLCAAMAPIVPALSASPHGRQERSDVAAKHRSGALATFDVVGERFRAWVTNPETVVQLIALRNGTSQAHIPNGSILRGPGYRGYNKPWHWHLDPKEIQMAEITTEVCDARPSYVEEHIADFVDTVKRYCPWAAKLVKLKLFGAAKQYVPAAPIDLRIVSSSVTTTSEQTTIVTLAWRHSSSGQTGFLITMTITRMHGGAGREQREAPANVSEARVTFVAGGINPATKACFTVSASNAQGESRPSNEVCRQV